MPERKDIAYHGGPDCQYPTFISIHDHGSDVCVTLRGKQVRNDAKGRNDPGPIAGMKMTHEEWAKIVADAAAYKRNP